MASAPFQSIGHYHHNRALLAVRVDIHPMQGRRTRGGRPPHFFGIVCMRMRARRHEKRAYTFL